MVKLIVEGLFTLPIMRFLVVGSISTLVDFLLYMCLSVWVFMPVAKGMSMTASCTFSFLLNKKWTFQDKQRNSASKIFKFVVAQIVNICVNVGTNSVIFMWSKNKLLAFIVATLVAMIANYTLQKLIVFKRN